MTMHRYSLLGTTFACLLASAGCGALYTGSGPARVVNEPREHGALRVASAVGNDKREAPEAYAPFIAPIAPSELTDVEPGAVLDVWLNDRHQGILSLSSQPSLGNAVVRGDFFRYSTVSSNPDLRTLWGPPLLLKWSALLHVEERGPYVFQVETSKERSDGAIRVRSLVRVNEQTLFEKEMQVFLGRPFSETGSSSLTLAPGYYRLEVWLSAENPLGLSPSTQLGTYMRVRSPSMSTAQPLPASWVWHPVRAEN